MNDKKTTSNNVEKMDAGKSLRILMEKREISREKLAKDIGFSLATASALRKNKLISGNALKKLCEYFNVSASEFFKFGEG